MSKNIGHFLAFNKEWFEKNQRVLIWFLNTPIIKYWSRWILRIHRDIPFTTLINRIEPNAFWFDAELRGNEIEVKTDFRTHPKFGKRIYYAFRPIWWTIHFWDWAVADRFVPQWSYGFSTLTAYPDDNAAGSPTSTDGSVEYSDTTWAATHNALTGGAAQVALAATYVAKANKNGASDWTIRRGFFLFDTSGLTAGATISAGVFSLNASGWGTTENADSFSINIVASTPASNTTLATADFDQVGTTVFSTLAYSSWVDTAGTYNDFTLDANGRANISKTGISKFAVRISLDTSNTQPTGANAFGCRFADTAGTTTDPKLVVTYTTVVGPANIKTYNGLAAASVKTINGLAIASVKTKDGLN